MTKYERRKWFERLCELRALYALRGPDDRDAVMSIDEAIDFAEDGLDAVLIVGEAIPDTQAVEIERRAA